MRGQQHVVGALRNAIRDERTGHAYLFSGPRGTGKTTAARILAKALNCTALADGEPCGVCDSCLGIDAGSSIDLHELDAASNNGVDAMRDLIARTAIGSPGRTKVYILDEVHMLSNAASNALLKTLEEPPDHVTFVLATTDPQKVIPTIRSRSQHFEFGLVPAAEMEAHVRWVIDDAGLTVDDAAVAHVVRRGAGSVRDTLSALEQVAALGRTVGDGEPLDGLVDALTGRNPGGALAGLAAALAKGREVRLIGEELLGRLRDAFLASVGATAGQLTEADEARAQAVAEALGPAGLTRALEGLGDALLEMRQAPDPRIPLEVALLRLTRPELDPSLAALTERIAALEQALATGAASRLAAPPSGATETSPALRLVESAPHSGGVPSTEALPAGDAAPAPAGGAAAEARRRLAERTGGTRSPAPSSPASPRTPTAVGVPMEERPPVAAPPPRQATEPEQQPDRATESAAASSAGEGVTLAAVLGAWEGGVLDALSGGARAWFRAGRFVSAEGTVAVFALPSEIHRDRCEEKRPETERKLAEALRRPLTLRLTVDGGGPPGADPDSARVPSGGQRPGPSAPPTEDLTDEDMDDIGDVGELEIADVDGNVLERVMQVFPGSQVVE